MGTYPTHPSNLMATGELLGDYLKKNPQLVGKSVLDRWGPEIPFLPKVGRQTAIVCDSIVTKRQILSFNKALPLQIHPDKKLAEQLHHEDPQKFGDANHKPEIAIALSSFELFAGWKTMDEIESVMKLKPLERFLPPYQNFTDDTLRQVAKSLLGLPPFIVSQAAGELRTMPESNFGKAGYIPGLLDRLRKQYGEFDNGILVAAVLMNYMTLGPGESVYVPADSIHAYLSGDIVECMARSDNVLNTGFCPIPERDNIDLFARALTFRPHKASDALLPRMKSEKGLNGKTDQYSPPFSEFNVLATWMSSGEKETHKAILGPSLMIVTKGSGRMKTPGDKTHELSEGYVFFIGQGVAVDLESEKGLAVYRPFTE